MAKAVHMKSGATKATGSSLAACLERITFSTGQMTDAASPISSFPASFDEALAACHLENTSLLWWDTYDSSPINVVNDEGKIIRVIIKEIELVSIGILPLHNGVRTACAVAGIVNQEIFRK